MTGGVEIACFTAESAHLALENGADRIELCAARDVGGVTPARETLEAVKYNFAMLNGSVPVFVMIRPRGGNFVYTDPEFQAMKRDVTSFVERGADGFVFGILTENGGIDVSRNKELVRMTSGKPCTFHRAFDVVANIDQALEEVIECGFRNILTAGSTDSQGAIAGVASIERLVQMATGRITIMPGGGVRSENIPLLKERTGAEWYHSSAIIHNEEDANSSEIRKLKVVV